MSANGTSNGAADHDRVVAEYAGLLIYGRRDEAEQLWQRVVSSRTCEGSAVDTLLTPYGIDEIFADDAPIDWVCEGLELCAGAPMVMGGYGFSGKTVFAQRLLVSVASGLDFCGMSVRQGKVLHIDLEQGRRLTNRRYRRIAHAMGLPPQELAGRLNVSVYPEPRMNLMQAASEDRMMRAADGCALVYIDSYLAACPGLKENDANAREPLDMLTRVSERTGAAFLVTAHANKPLPIGKRQGGERMSLRGSGALYDASGSCWIAIGAKGKPTWLAHEKAKHTGTCRADLTMAISDADDGGLNVDISERIDSDPDIDPREQKRASDRAKLRAKILDAVRAHPRASSNAIASVVGARRESVLEELEGMRVTGRVVAEDGPRNGQLWSIPTEQEGQ